MWKNGEIERDLCWQSDSDSTLFNHGGPTSTMVVLPWGSGYNIRHINISRDLLTIGYLYTNDEKEKIHIIKLKQDILQHIFESTQVI